MEDPGLNRRIDESRELQTRWSQFHDFLNLALKGEKVTAEAEMKFIELKTRICMLHDAFMQSIRHDYKVGQQVLSILGQCILLRRIPQLSNGEVQKIELDWSEAYMLMNETIASLEEERQKLAGVNERTYKLKKLRDVWVARIHNILMSGQLQFIVLAIVVPLFIIFGVPMLGIYDYRDLKKDLPFTAGVYDWTMNLMRSKFSEDIPYDSLELVKSVPVNSDQYGPDTSSLDKVTVDFLISQLVNIGFSDKNLNDAKNLLKGSKAFNKEGMRMNRTRKKLLAYYILFNNTADARRFVDLRKAGLASYDESVRKKVNAVFNVCRKSNFVAIFGSEESMLRVDYAKAKWEFRDDQMNL